MTQLQTVKPHLVGVVENIADGICEVYCVNASLIMAGDLCYCLDSRAFADYSAVRMIEGNVLDIQHQAIYVSIPGCLAQLVTVGDLVIFIGQTYLQAVNKLS